MLDSPCHALLRSKSANRWTIWYTIRYSDVANPKWYSFTTESRMPHYTLWADTLFNVEPYTVNLIYPLRYTLHAIRLLLWSLLSDSGWRRGSQLLALLWHTADTHSKPPSYLPRQKRQLRATLSPQRSIPTDHNRSHHSNLQTSPHLAITGHTKHSNNNNDFAQNDKIFMQD